MQTSPTNEILTTPSAVQHVPLPPALAISLQTRAIMRHGLAVHGSCSEAPAPADTRFTPELLAFIYALAYCPRTPWAVCGGVDPVFYRAMVRQMSAAASVAYA